MYKESNNPQWKGESASYSAVHKWVKQQIGKPDSCKFCGKVGRNQWASISRTAKRDIEDYMSLCPSCHKTYDLNGKVFDASIRKYVLTEALN